MLAADSAFSLGFNWYDVVVLVALVYGVWSGVRTGFSGELIRVIGLVLMVVLALRWQPAVGEWLNHHSQLPLEAANVTAFVGIAVLIYAVTLLLRWAVHRRLQKMTVAAFVENIGGGIAGVVRMLVVMGWLTFMLCLLPSDFWHRQIAHNSRFGAAIVQRVPAVADLVQKHFPDKSPLFKDLQRRPEPAEPDDNPAEDKPAR